jgi:hypothetical protein
MLPSSIFRATRSVMVVVAVLAAAVTSAPARADCGDPGQPACTGPVPSTYQALAVLARMADPGVPAASKTDVVTPGFASDEAATIDNHLGRMEAFGGLLPPNLAPDSRS